MSAMKPSEYIKNERHKYSIYTIKDRAIPTITDGLKPSWRRCLWKGRDGSKWKTATLAGAAMSIHPHAAPEDAINTIAGPYLNNIPLFEGIGGFGTLIHPNGCSAGRYTSVKLSDFTKKVLMADLDIVPMRPNYDETEMEPVHFLPLVPVCLLNPSSGLAVGFSSNILPRKLTDIIKSQLEFLAGKKIKEPNVSFTPIGAVSVNRELVEKSGNIKWTFNGTFTRTEKRGVTTVQVTALPYGMSHGEYIAILDTLVEKDIVADYTDSSKRTISILIKMKGREATDYSDDKLRNVLKLVSSTTENLTVVDEFDRPWKASYTEIVEKFTKWRLEWYVKRYEQQLHNLSEDLTRVTDVMKAIDGGITKSKQLYSNRQALMQWCVGKKIVNPEYVAQLPMYRFTQEEYDKLVIRKDELESQIATCNVHLKDENMRRQQYISDLKEVAKQFKDL